MSEPMNFRKKPVIIQAKQLTEESCWLQWEGNIPFWADQRMHISGSWHPERRTISDAYIIIPTLEGQMRASLGDWIIKGIRGEFYPCKPDIFDATYEAVPSPITVTD